VRGKEQSRWTVSWRNAITNIICGDVEAMEDQSAGMSLAQEKSGTEKKKRTRASPIGAPGDKKDSKINWSKRQGVGYLEVRVYSPSDAKTARKELEWLSVRVEKSAVNRAKKGKFRGGRVLNCGQGRGKKGEGGGGRFLNKS